MNRLLVVAAHPDDEVLGCGATIAKERERGAAVRIVILADGITARYTTIDKQAQQELHALYQHAAQAGKVLGLAKEDLIFGRFPDMKMNTVPFIDIVQFVKNVVQDFRPDRVYTHHRGDYNVDHRITFDATLFASRPCHGEHFPKQLYAFEVPSSTEWAYQVKDGFRPTVFNNVEKTINSKIAAMEQYQSEVRAYPHPRSPEGLDILAKKRGLEASMRYAEAFELIREIHD